MKKNRKGGVGGVKGKSTRGGGLNMYNCVDVYQYTEHWLLHLYCILLRAYKLKWSSSTIVNFHLFYNGPVDYANMSLLTRRQCKVSDTQVTVKACGSLGFFFPLLSHHFKLKKFSFFVVLNRNTFILGIFKTGQNSLKLFKL